MLMTRAPRPTRKLPTVTRSNAPAVEPPPPPPMAASVVSTATVALAITELMVLEFLTAVILAATKAEPTSAAPAAPADDGTDPADAPATLEAVATVVAIPANSTAKVVPSPEAAAVRTLSATDPINDLKLALAVSSAVNFWVSVLSFVIMVSNVAVSLCLTCTLEVDSSFTAVPDNLRDAARARCLRAAERVPHAKCGAQRLSV